MMFIPCLLNWYTPDLQVVSTHFVILSGKYIFHRWPSLNIRQLVVHCYGNYRMRAPHISTKLFGVITLKISK